MYSRPLTAAVSATLMALMLLSGCSGRAIPASTPTTATEAPGASIAPEADAATPKPAAQSQTPDYSFTSTTAEMTPEMEKSLLQYRREGDDRWNTDFKEATKADLDGDGKEESIQLLPGKANTDMENRQGDFTSIAVKIDEQTLTIQAGKKYGFTSPLPGTITDINEKDGRKEVLVYEEGTDFYDGTQVCAIAYLHKKPKAVMPWSRCGEFNGTGYKLDSEIAANKKIKTDSAGFYIYVYKRYRADGSGFDTVKSKYYRSPIYTMIPAEGEVYGGATAQYDTLLAKEPGGKREVPIKAGTKILFGLYEPRGWIEVLTPEGNELGWLDITDINLDAFSDYAFTQYD